MIHSQRWDAGDRWDQRPIRAAAYLIVALFVAFTWGVLSAATTSPTDDTPLSSETTTTGPIRFGSRLGTVGSGDSNIASPILFGTRIGTTGTGDGNVADPIPPTSLDGYKRGIASGTNQLDPVLFGAKIGSTGGGDGNFA